MSVILCLALTVAVPGLVIWLRLREQIAARRREQAARAAALDRMRTLLDHARRAAGVTP